MKTSNFGIAFISLVLAGCSSLSSESSPERPMAFHDTRLQYALITGDDETLRRDFDMKLSPSWAERTAAGVALPFSAASEAVFWPFLTAIKAWAPSQTYGHSAQ